MAPSDRQSLLHQSEPDDYGTLKFVHAIAGLPAPPPEAEIIDVAAYTEQTITGLMQAFGILSPQSSPHGAAHVPTQGAHMKVYLVLDHEDFTVAVFATRESAEAHIAKEWEAIRPPVLWRVEETEVRP